MSERVVRYGHVISWPITDPRIQVLDDVHWSLGIAVDRILELEALVSHED